MIFSQNFCKITLFFNALRHISRCTTIRSMRNIEYRYLLSMLLPEVTKGKTTGTSLAHTPALTFFTSSRVVNTYGTVSRYLRTDVGKNIWHQSKQRAIQQIFFIASLKIRRERRRRRSFSRVFLHVTRNG